LSDEGAALQMASARDEVSIFKALANVSGSGCRHVCVISLAFSEMPFRYRQEQVAPLHAVTAFNESLRPREPAIRLTCVPPE
jgi:hypothetical protein